MPTPSDSGYWQSAYDEQRTRWDSGGPPPAWAELCRLHAIPTGRTLVMGAGRGHDALWFAGRGDTVTAVDFAPSAIAAMRGAVAGTGTQLDIRGMDLFDVPKAGWEPFDLLVEHTCFCAIEPSRRPEYVDVVRTMTRPGGLLIGVFFLEIPPDGPPFPSTLVELRERFSPHFEVLRLEQNPHSAPSRAGREGWGVFRRRGSQGYGARPPS